MIWLGWNQYKLQKRQTQAQEYDIYRKLYKLLKNANREIDEFMYTLWVALKEYQYKIDENFLQRKQAIFDELRNDLKENYIDYELKFSKDVFNKDGYLKLLSMMANISQKMILLLKNNEMIIGQEVCRIEYGKCKEDDAYADDIVQQIPNQNLQTGFMYSLGSFLVQRKMMRCDNTVLDKIKDKCKID